VIVTPRLRLADLEQECRLTLATQTRRFEDPTLVEISLVCRAAPIAEPYVLCRAAYALGHASSPHVVGIVSPQRSHVVVAAWLSCRHSGHGHAGTFIAAPLRR